MDIQRSFIPAEILTIILDYLPKKDIKNIRRVCQAINVLAAPLLFRSLYISTRLKDRKAFTSVSEHPVLSQLVKEVVYDSTNISMMEGNERFSLNKTSYTRFLIGCQSNPRSVKYTKAAFERGFQAFAECYEEQRRLAEYDEEDMTHPRDNRRLKTPKTFNDFPGDFSSMIMDKAFHKAVAVYLPDDLVRLVAGLPQMPRVRHFAISDRRYSQHVKHRTHTCIAADSSVKELTLSFKNEGIRGIDQIILNPRSWPSTKERSPPLDFDRSSYRGFFVLMQAASMTKLEKLESFKVITDCEESGLGKSIFQMSPRELYHTINAFSSLKTIKLNIHTRERGGGYWELIVAQGDLAKALGAATQLENLDLRLDSMVPEQVVSFTELIGTHTWPNLRSTTLAAMALDMRNSNDFLEFFYRHCQTLRTLRLENVMLMSNRSFCGEAANVVQAHWSKTFQSMASRELVLTDFSHYHWDTVLAGPHQPRFHSCDAATIFCFLRSGGTDRGIAHCHHQRPLVSFY